MMFDFTRTYTPFRLLFPGFWTNTNHTSLLNKGITGLGLTLKTLRRAGSRIKIILPVVNEGTLPLPSCPLVYTKNN